MVDGEEWPKGRLLLFPRNKAGRLGTHRTHYRAENRHAAQHFSGM